MPAPTAYSESVFADYLTTVLGEFATLLGWSPGSPAVQEALSDALLELGVPSIAAVTTPFQIRGLRALGRRAIWRAVVQATAGKYSFGDAGQSFQRKQMNDMSVETLKLVEVDCLPWDPNYAVSIVGVKRPSDPYVVIPDTERVP